MTAGKIVVRSAVKADLIAIGRLGASLVQEHHDFDPLRFIPPSPQTPKGYASFLGSQLEKMDVMVLVAMLHDDVVGYVYATVEGFDYMALRGPAGAIQDIVVDAAYRGQGIGRLLLDSVIAALTARGVPRVVLSTAEQNVGAQRFFASAGFRRTMIEMTRELGA